MRKKLILTIVLLSYFVTAIDASIVTTGLTMIKSDLNLNQVSLSWLQNAYLLVFGGMVLLGGRLGDLVGRKRIFIISLALFGIGSLFAGISQGATLMILARFIQGVGAAILAPTSLALLMDNFEGPERIKAIAWYSSVSGIGTSVGMVLGGFLASTLSWRYGFFINIPLTIFMIVVAIKVLETQSVKKEHYDVWGSLFSILGLFALVYSINGAKNILLWFILALILLTAFVIIEAKVKKPMMPLSLFADRSRVIAYLVRAMFVGSMMGYFFFAAEFLQGVLHYSPLMTGFAFFPLTFCTFIAALKVPAMVDKYGNKNTLLLGMTFLVLGFGLIILMSGFRSFWINIGIPSILLGFGQGFAMSPLTNLGIQGASREDSGAASGLVNAAHQIGGSIGISIMVALTAQYTATSTIFKFAMIISLTINIIGLMISFIVDPK